MLGAIVGYYVLAVVIIFVAQLATNGLVTLRENAITPTLQNLPESEHGPILDRFLRVNAIMRIASRAIVLFLLGYFAWAIGSSYDGWWWVFWLMFAYNLFGGLFTIGPDITGALNPTAIRKAISGQDN